MSCPDGDGNHYAFDWHKHIGDERYLEGMLNNGVPVEREQLEIGDILYFRAHSRFVTHGGIYLGNGEFVHSVTGRGVEIGNMNHKFWKNSYAGAIRLRNLSFEDK